MSTVVARFSWTFPFTAQTLSCMLQGKVKNHADDLVLAQMLLKDRMAIWSPESQDNREYMVCYAAAGHRIQFYAVTNGGGNIKAISPEFDLREKLDRLKVFLASSCKLKPSMLRHGCTSLHTFVSS